MLYDLVPRDLISYFSLKYKSSQFLFLLQILKKKTIKQFTVKYALAILILFHRVNLTITYLPFYLKDNIPYVSIQSNFVV